ncbi:proline racemase family protein [bacterium]|nr:proline racemase family protein [bacterium]
MRIGVQFKNCISTIDSHTAGESTRLVINGIGPLPGSTMKEKRDYFIQNLDHIRKQLTLEPRGHRDILTAVVTKPVTSEASFGLIYMDPRRYPFLCGHATIGAVVTLIDIGFISLADGKQFVTVDTPSGPMKTSVEVKNGRAVSVTLRMVPSFTYKTGERVNVPGYGELEGETVCVGGFFIMINASQINIALKPENSRQLIDLGMTLIECANQQLSVAHPERPEVDSIDVVEFYDDIKDGSKHSRGIVIYGESHMDRSPCGTGTTAKMTLLQHLGHLKIGETYINAGPLGTEFRGCLIEETKLGKQPVVIAEITGNAQITGYHQFVLDANDPFPEGFLI